MDTLAPLGHALHHIFSVVPDACAREVGFTQRRSKLTAAAFTQALVGGWLANPDASLTELSHAAATAGVRITAQGLAQRFTPSAAACLKQTLEAAAGEMIAATPAAVPLLARFAGVYLDDTTVVALPDALADIWRGNGGSPGSAAAVKLHVRWDWSSGALQGPWPVPGRSHDQRSPLPPQALPPGSLRLADLGYFNVSTLAALDRTGNYWLTRLQSSTGITDAAGRRWRLAELLGGHPDATLDLAVGVGERRLPARLLAIRVPPAAAEQRRRRLREAACKSGQTVTAERLALADWNYWITNVPREMLTLDEALALGRVRWQLELLFKLWKQHGRLGHSRSRQRWWVLCEVYAKLLAVVVQHWLVLTSGWQRLDRSLVKAAAAVRKFALPLLLAFRWPDRLAELVAVLARCLAGCYVNRRRSRPPTFQLLQGVKLYA